MTREEIHELPWKAQEYINELERKLTLTDVSQQSEQLVCQCGRKEVLNVCGDCIDKMVREGA